MTDLVAPTVHIIPYPLGEQSEHLLVVLGEPGDERLQLGDLLLPPASPARLRRRTLRLLGLTSCRGSLKLFLGWGWGSC